MSTRINVVLSDRTLTVLDRVAAKGTRSQFISRAVLHFIETQGKQSLRERLKHEALANAGRDLAIAADWFPLDEEAWQNAEAARTPRKARKPNSA